MEIFIREKMDENATIKVYSVISIYQIMFLLMVFYHDHRGGTQLALTHHTPFCYSPSSSLPKHYLEMGK